MTIGERIKCRRTELSWTLRELSNRMGYSDHSTIAKIEAGKVDIPQSRVVQFSEVLGVSLEYLMGIEENKKNQLETHEHCAKILMDKEFISMFDEFQQLSAKKKKIVKDLVHSLADL